MTEHAPIPAGADEPPLTVGEALSALRADGRRLVRAIKAAVSEDPAFRHARDRGLLPALGASLGGAVRRTGETVTRDIALLTHSEPMRQLASEVNAARLQVAPTLQRHPLTSVLVAAAVGMALGMGRRR